MDAIRDDAIGGFNSFLKEQQQVPGDANMTMMLFDDQFLMVHQGLPLKDVPELDKTTFVPRGGTALLDAIGRTLNETEARLAAMADADRPSKVLVLVLTDGMENQSKEFDKGRIQKMIKDHEAKGWEFMYLKAGPDTFDQARDIGFSTANYANVGASGNGLLSAYGGINARTCSYRAGGQSALLGESLQSSVNAAAAQIENQSGQSVTGSSVEIKADEGNAGG